MLKKKNLIIGGAIAVVAVIVALFSGGHKEEQVNAPPHRNIPSLKHFPKDWRLYKGEGFEIYLPSDARLKVKNGKIALSYRHGEGGLVVTNYSHRVERSLTHQCRPKLTMEKEGTTFYLCRRGKPYLEVVTKGSKPALVSYVRAGDFSTLKAISLALASFRPLRPGGEESPQSIPRVSFVKWTPRDGSFTIVVPSGWQTTGGTADFGRNGYVRIVRTMAPDGSAGFLGVYYPFHQYAQTAYGNNGMAPMSPQAYFNGPFFNLLASNYRIYFNDLRISNISVDGPLSRQLSYQQQVQLRRGGVNAAVKIQAVMGKATFNYNGEPFEMAILGTMRYLTYPLQGMGYSYVWGPAPIYIEAARKGTLSRWFPVLKRVAESWQVNTGWLMRHQRMAAQDARRTVEHYRRMSKMIHEGYEKRSRMGMRQWESEEHERMEEFWDTYYALGGEERYDNPQTGEEVDVPIGADKYLYDSYSQSWVGVTMDQPNAQELIQNLKENGFVELKRHRH